VTARDGSFDVLIARLRAGDEDAAAEIFHRFARRLVRLARQRLGEGICRKEDARDVLQSVFRSFFTRFRTGQFDLRNWESLWGILTVITLRKCGNRVEYFLAACRDVRREVSLNPSDESGAGWEAIARDPLPSEAAVLADTVEQLMRGLEERDQEILSLHLQGYTVPEISERIERAERTVHRALERVRKRLRRMGTDEEEGNPSRATGSLR